MLNKAILIGNLGADPDVRYIPNGNAVATVRLATTRRWKDKQTNDRKEDTEWHRVVFYGKLAEVVSEYVKKGSQIYVEGRIETKKWQDKDGQDRYTTQIVAEEMHMIGGGKGKQEHGAQNVAPQRQPEPATVTDDSDFDDDIPF